MTTSNRCTGVVAAACTQGKRRQHGKPHGVARDGQPEAREGQAGLFGVAERLVLPLKPGNAGGGKGPQFKTNARRGEGSGDWATYQLRKVFRSCRRRYTRKRRQKPSSASMPCTTRSIAKIFWLMLMLSAAPTRAPGVDGQDFSDIEAYGVERWLGELALALREESVSTGSHQTSVHPEVQRQRKAAGHFDRARSGLHDSSDAGAGADLRR